MDYVNIEYECQSCKKVERLQKPAGSFVTLDNKYCFCLGYGQVTACDMRTHDPKPPAQYDMEREAGVS